ncbi:MAG: hypothetical protein ACI4RP_09135 [Acutalibacteraceae bacterium]
MLEPMNALDRFSRANTPHPSATLTPSPQGEGLSLSKTQQKLNLIVLFDVLSLFYH